MDLHTRIVAGLHIAFGLIGALFMVIGTLAMGGMGLMTGPDMPWFVFGLGTAALGILALLALAQAVAGFLLYKGHSAGRIAVIVFGVLSLLQFPLGTALGLYTLWVLLIRKPQIISK